MKRGDVGAVIAVDRSVMLDIPIMRRDVRPHENVLNLPPGVYQVVYVHPLTEGPDGGIVVDTNLHHRVVTP